MAFPSWQMHRGYWRKGVRENTMAAFEAAAEAQCEMVELDVQISRDGIPHVFHDFDLKRFFHIEQKLARTSSVDLDALNVPKLSEVLRNQNVPRKGFNWCRTTYF